MRSTLKFKSGDSHRYCPRINRAVTEQTSSDLWFGSIEQVYYLKGILDIERWAHSS